MIRFPPVASADASGLLCVSDFVDASLLWAAYRQGVFPWTDEPVGWFAPPERGVLVPSEARFPRNTAKLWRRGDFRLTCDQAFDQVIRGCQRAHRREGEWITDNFVAAYCDLARAHHAHSIEVYQHGELVGGLYGVEVGPIFAAESMFGTVPNASRAALYALVQAAPALGLELIDVQVVSPATRAVGARPIERALYMRHIEAAQKRVRPNGRVWPGAAMAAVTTAVLDRKIGDVGVDGAGKNRS